MTADYLADCVADVLDSAQGAHDLASVRDVGARDGGVIVIVFPDTGTRYLSERFWEEAE